MMGFPRLTRTHGPGRVVVRGEIMVINPGMPAIERTGLMKLLFGSQEEGHPQIYILIDDEPHEKLQAFLRERVKWEGQPCASVNKMFGTDVFPLVPGLKVGDRVWVTFSYSNEMNMWFQGDKPVFPFSIKIIEDETETQENELLADAPTLPMSFA